MSSLRERNILYARLEDILGTEPAGILMSHIPTETDLATKSDVTHLGSRFETRMDSFETRMDRLETRMERFEDKLDGFHAALREQTRTYMFTMTGVMASFSAVIVATGILT